MDTSNVRYHCPCADSPADSVGPSKHAGSKKPSANQNDVAWTGSEIAQGQVLEGDKAADISLLDKRLPFALHWLHELYFCEDCGCARCPRCVMEEVSLLFCPNCLFEVPAKSSLSSGLAPDAVCNRSCFRCPRCLSALQPTEENSQTTDAQERRFHLECMYCQWTSKASGLVFDKGVNLVKQVAQQYTNPREIVFRAAHEAARARQEAEKREEYVSQLRGLSLQDLEEEQEATSFLLAPRNLDMSYEHENAVKSLLELTSLDDNTSRMVGTPADDMGQMLPLSTPLRTRRAKRCRACRHILCKFETRQPVMQSVKFRIRLAASSYLPTLQFSPRPPDAVSLTSSDPAADAPGKIQYLLKIANPLYEQIKVTLSAPNMTELGDQVTVHAPEIYVGGFTDVWNEVHPTGNQPSRGHKQLDKGSNAILGRLHSSGSNWATIEISVTPHGLPSSRDQTAAHLTHSDDLLVPLFVSMEYEADTEMAGAEQLDNRLSGNARSTRKVGFWTVLNATRPAPVSIAADAGIPC